VVKNQNLEIYRKFFPHLNERCSVIQSLMKYATVKERIQEPKTSQALLQKYSESNNSCVRKANMYCRKASYGIYSKS